MVPNNPFFNRGPIFDARYFFGRKRELAALLGLLSGMQNASVVGPIKMGKTSLLLHLARDQVQREHGLAPEQFAFCYLDLEGLGQLSQQGFFHLMLREMLRQGSSHPTLASHQPLPSAGEISFPELLSRVELLERSGLNLVWMMDEFGLAAGNPNFDLNFFSALRALASRPQVALVTATQHSLHRMAEAGRQVGSPLADLFTTIRLGPLESQQADELVHDLSLASGEPLTEEIGLIRELAGYHPFFLQLLCCNLVEQRRSPPGRQPATQAFVTTQFCHQIEPFLDCMWAGMEQSERERLLAGWPDLAGSEECLQILREAGLCWREGCLCPPAADFLEKRIKETEIGGFQVAEPAGGNYRVADYRMVYAVVRALARAASARQPLALRREEEIAKLAVAVGRALGWSDQQLECLKVTARLRDIGLIGISDLILLKPGPLTDIERQVIQAHTMVGAQILEALDFPWPVRPAVRSHHERWDGSGYPDGLMGEEIPPEARVLSVADVFLAMTADRPYRAAWPRETALQELTMGAGSRYDPRAVQALLRALE